MSDGVRASSAGLAPPTVTASASRLEFIPGSLAWILDGADGSTLVRSPSSENVAPEAHRGGLPAHPRGVVDLEPVGAVLDVEAAGRPDVKRHHVIVGVPAK